MSKLLVAAVKKIQSLSQRQRYKQVILVRDDLKLPKGKMAAQVGHACVDAVLKANKGLVQDWRAEGMMKIVLKVDNERDMLDLQKHAEELELVTAVITDAGHTVVEPGTVTCCAIGPGPVSKIDRVTKHLSLM